MVERNKYNRAIVRAEVEGLKGSAEVCWTASDHWSAFICVPYQDSRWVYLGGKREDEDSAIAKAQRELEYRLASCTMI
ncbi:MAG: hypothetical protein MJ007_01990 [Paludibacteraceae bacterium]|nr:hypothetical protein [Paludibacteraceae bacterium]